MKYTTEGLEKAGIDLSVPFQIDVYLDPESSIGDVTKRTLHFERLNRVLPRRRLSGIATYEGETVFAKIFYGRKARRYWSRELHGAALMAGSEVPSAGVIGQGATVDERGYVVLYRALLNAEGLDEGNADEMADAVRCLARMHDVNVIQTDPHLDNFVRSDYAVYAVDADGLRRAFLIRHHITNLATLLAQRAPQFDEQIEQIWEIYAAHRGAYVARMGSAEQLRQATRKARRLRVRRYLKKTQRECSEFVHRRKFTRDFLCDRNHWPQLQRFMVFPEEVLNQGVPLKLGNSATVVRCVIEGETYVVKRYNIKSLRHRVRRWIKRRARNAWTNGHWLDFLGVDTAKPVALLERRWGWFAGVSYLVMPDCGERDLIHTLTSEPARFSELAPQTVRILRKMHDAGVAHGDLKATNFIVQGPKVLLIDYDSVRVGDLRRDIDRFLKNWSDEPEKQAAWRSQLAAAGL